MLELILGRVGTGKSEYLYERLGECARGDAEKIILIVPEQYSFESERNILTRLGNRLAQRVEVLSFTRLCDRFFREYGGRAGTRLDDAARSLLMYEALHEIGGELKLYGRETDMPGFVQEMVDFTSRLKFSRITPEDFAGEGAALPPSALKDKIYDLSLIAASFDAAVGRAFRDPQDDLSLLEKGLQEHDFFRGSVVAADSFKDFTAQELGVLSHIIRGAERTIITLGADSLSGEGRLLFSPIRKTAGRLIEIAKKENVPVKAPVCLTELKRPARPELIALERGFFEPSAPAFGEDAPGITVCEAQTVYDEADYIARTIRRLVRGKGYRYRDFAVICRNASDYKGVLLAAFQKYSVSCFVDRRLPLVQQPLAVLILSALSAVEKGFRTEDILKLLKTGIAGLSAGEVSRLENYTYTWRLTGRAWLTEWEKNPRGFTPETTEADQKNLEELNLLRAKAMAPLLAFRRRTSGERTGEEFGGAVFSFLQECAVPRHLKKLAKELEAQGLPDDAETQRAAWELMMRLLNQAAAVCGGRKLTLPEYRSRLELVVSSCDFGHIPVEIDEVQLGDADRIRPAKPKVVFVAGANSGVFPREGEEGGLFTGEERRKLSERGLELFDDREEAALKERFLAYTAVTAPSELLFVTYPAADSAGNALNPSLIVQQIRALFPRCRLVREQEDILSRAETETGAFELYAREYRGKTQLAASLRTALSSREGGQNQLRSIESSARGTDFSLSPERAKKLYGDRVSLSATRIERYHHCPFSYFCKFGVGASPRKIAEMDVLERGTLIHYALEKLVQKHGGRGLAALSDEDLRREITELLDRYLDEVMGGAGDKSERFLYLYGRLRETLFALLRHIGAELAQSRFEPVAFELAIHEDGPVTPAKIRTPGGADIAVHGVVDRVDVMRDGDTAYLRIVDYKTGSTKFSLENVLHGFNLQMLLYLFTLTEDADSKFRGMRPAGILYMPAKRPVRTDKEAPEDPNYIPELRMSGLVLGDSTVIAGMERDGLGRYIPAKLNASGEVGKQNRTATEQLFRELHRHISRLLLQMADHLRAGDIRRTPVNGKDKPACQYCDYAAVCGVDDQTEFEEVLSMSMEEIEKALKGEETDGVPADEGTKAGN